MHDLQKYSKKITKNLDLQLQKNAARYNNDSTWGKTAFTLLFEFAKSGKMIRGNLFLESYSILSHKKDPMPYIDLACGLELIQSGLLIHDDIMDQDTLRRGNPTIHKQLEKLTNSKLTSESLAICIGDMAFFAAVDLASNYDSHIVKAIAQEIVIVGIGQMQDVSPIHKTSENILSTYTLKTGRYTFSLPFYLAGLLSNQNKKTVDNLLEIGEKIGVLFQIRDDYLGIFGESITTGKNASSDITEDKLTIYKACLEEKKDSYITNYVLPLFGKKDITENEYTLIKKTLTDYEILKRVQELEDTYKIEAKSSMEQLENAHMKKFLGEILEYVTSRGK